MNKIHGTHLKREFGKYYLGLGAFMVGLALLFLLTDLKYKVKYLAESLLREETGWLRKETKIDEGAYRVDLYSPELLVNQIWPSMTGPAAIHRFALNPGSAPELVWLTGYSTQVVDAEMNTVLDEAYLCHNNLDYSVASYYRNWGVNDRVGVLTPRLATITQGQTKIKFPKGYGIPFMSNQLMTTATQALNLFEPDLDISVRHKISVDYKIASEIERPFKPLYQQSVCVLIKIDTNRVDTLGHKIQMDCRPALASIAFSNIREDGEAYTGHWVVNLDRDTVSYNVTTILSLGEDTRLHYAGVHVHPYCEYLELRDLTSGKVVFKSEITHEPEVMKMIEIDVYSSSEGTMMYADHQYALTCITNNVSQQEQDMMAVMLLYLHDKEMEEAILKM